MTLGIDWSKAPEGSTHYFTPGDGFVRIIAGIVYYWDGEWRENGCKQGDYTDGALIARPAKCDGNHGGPRCADHECWIDDEFVEIVAPAWTGEGLPPVGTDCACGLLGRLDPAPINQWREGETIKCVAHVFPQGGAPLPLFWNARTCTASTLASHCYSPIRTPEQIAADARIAAAQDWLKGVEREYGVGVADECESILMAAERRWPRKDAPEQIGPEDRAKAIDAMVKFSPLMDMQWSKLVCAALYDAGCRPPKGVAQ